MHLELPESGWMPLLGFTSLTLMFLGTFLKGLGLMHHMMPKCSLIQSVQEPLWKGCFMHLELEIARAAMDLTQEVNGRNCRA